MINTDRQQSTSQKKGTTELLETAQNAAIAAGQEILEIYYSDDFSTEAKADNSPLTRADKKAHDVITKALKATDLPILSEEGRETPYSIRKNWKRFWMVDPLDGTKEFIKKNGEFTVNIALIENGRPILGVVYTPVANELFWGMKDTGSFFKDENGKVKRLETSKSDLKGRGIRAVASRSHLSEETRSYLGQFDEPEIVSKGSSLKFLLVASGQADVYPRFGPTMEWDTAAADVIVKEAGGQVLKVDGIDELVYNKQDLLNPYFIVLPSNISSHATHS